MHERRITAAIATRLSGDGRPSLVVVHAPAGFGKTGLLRDCVAGRPHVDWIDCRRPDAPEPAIDPGITRVLDEPERWPPAARARIVGRALAAADGDTPLFVATRRIADLPLARWLASERAVIVPAARLALSRGEVDQICARRIPRAQAAALHRMTEGWPAATMLLLRWLETGGAIDPAGAWLNQSGIVDYVEQEVLADLTPALRDTLTLAGLCDGREAAMIDALDPRRALGGRFRELVAALPGLVTLHGPGYRLHPLIAAVADMALCAAAPAERDGWLRRGADWLAARGELVGAARMAVRAGEPQLIRRYIHAAGGLRLWLDGKIEMVGELLALAGDGTVEGDVRMSLLRCVRLLKEGRAAAAERLFAATAAGESADPVVRQEGLIVRSALIVYGCQLDGPIDLRSMDAPEVDAPWGSMWPTLRLVANAQAGEMDLARACLHRARAESDAAGFTYNLIFLDVHEAEIELACGGLAAARTVLDRARRRWRRGFPDDRGLETVIAATTAQLEFECGRTLAARNQLRIAHGSLPDAEAWLDTYLANYEPRFRLLAAERGLPAALSAIHATTHLLDGRGLGRIARLLDALATCIAGERALVDGVTAIPAPPDPPGGLDRLVTWQEREIFWLASAYRDLGTGGIAAAVARLEALRDDAATRGLRRTELRASLLLVAALDRAGRRADATAAFGRALDLGMATGSHRAFVEFGGPAVADRLHRSGQAAFAALSRRGQPPPQGPIGGVGATLTAREVEILRAVRAGGSDKVVGRRVGLTEHGVRFHLKKLFRRYAVHDRIALIAATSEETT